ncbi:visual pigment-like receptor peropsin isoform X3 [Physeter macrocephalus]|uniref:Visual pigment-like receptor peropsin isoform X3 n=1 Tax=Physeter macrocephalus TaxID=9755 RepID=A0A455BVX9_PHYMC|nr:visual pigment-like receptor peropsin isoform X3 [Physeter catodon]|eukprot:XP_028347976.1 visual pigment-like receptor peropsin isoform X3 [Physeter catodon]
MLRNNLGNSSDSKNEDGLAFSQTEHNIVAAYLITADGEAILQDGSTSGEEHVWVKRENLWVPFERSPIKSCARMISVLSNIIVLGIFIKYKELRTPTNAIIINLAVTDIGVSSIGYPMSAASDLHGSWKFGHAGCQIYAGLNIFFGMASIGLLTVVAVDRYLTICCPDAGRRMTTNTYISMILGAWINGLFWALMPIVGWASYAPDPTGATCTINWRKNDVSFVSYTMMVVAINFIVPLIMMFYCYYHVTRSIKHHATSNCTEYLNRDWSDQVDVTKVPEGDACHVQMSDSPSNARGEYLTNGCTTKPTDFWKSLK